MLTQRKVWLFRLVMAVVFPILVVAGLEFGLRLAGIRSDPLIRVRQADGDWWTTNPQYGRAIFPREAGPTLPALWLPADKAEGEVRIVVLGESAAEGFPLSAFGMGRVLETVIRERNPEANVRAISLAMAGINSHQIRQLGRAAARRLSPDIVVVYAGNNEVVGPFGPAAVMARYASSLWWIRLQQGLRGLSLSRVADAWAGRGGHHERKTWGGLDEFRGVEIADDDPRLHAMGQNFEKNLGQLVDFLTRRNIKVLVSTMAVNLTDWPPMASEYEPGPERFEYAAAPDPDALRSAVLAYRWAEELRQAGYAEQAWRFYRRAADLDRVRFRADSRINGALRTMGGIRSGNRVRLVDVDRLLHEEDAAGGDDARWFYEHVHLNIPGRIQVASRWVDVLHEAGWLSAPQTIAGDEGDAITRALLFTPMDELQALTIIREFYRWPQFANQLYGEQRIAALEEAMNRARAERHGWTAGRVAEELAALRVRHPRDAARDAAAGAHLLALGDPAGAVQALTSALALEPRHPQARADAAAAALRLGDLDAAARHLEAALAWNPRHPHLLLIRAEWAMAASRWPEAERDLLQVHAMLPKHLGAILHLARLAEARRDWSGAERRYREGLAISPDSGPLLSNLAMLLATRPDGVDEARRLAIQATEVIPDSPHAWWTLGRVEMRAGNRDAAAAAWAAAEQRSKPERDDGLLEAIRRERAALTE
ncbi:MAG TPA: tetratricopeptide repeat protein [Kiritimatiellia bacterium]|nr:tetratricopeptide repeat protein [Kiritimatiellia bacterium]HMP00496.1 tetratricopeptide repeat protein [Kiritimatiellia bacterium]HMP98090.1 tetratricopeptide repeat protein [Kiritimatiellia bacterium]